MYDIAYHYHFQPSEMWEMDVIDTLFWYSGLNYIAKEQKNG